ASYFGIDVNHVLRVGDVAKHFVREKLSAPFVIRTCWKDAMGRSRIKRFFAFVQTRNGDLGEQLVENGLARTRSAINRAEGLTTATAEWQKLANLEKKARQERVGGWGVGENRMEVRAQQPESEKGMDPFKDS